jgi:hypothetical protein
MNLTLSHLKIWTLAAIALAGGFSSSAQSSGRATTKDFSAFQIISDRNIFNPNRRPRIQNDRRPATIVDSFALTGTMSYSDVQLAVFDGTSSDYHKALERGGKIAGYSVAEIGHDSVKLSSGTNNIDLKVGMQMRRSEDGKWAASEASVAPSYASAARPSTGSSRWEGRRESSSGRNGSRNNFRNEGGSRSVPSEPSGANAVAPPDASAVMVPPTEGNIPPEAANLDPNDPVARLMLRRLQEMGGASAAPNDSAPPNGNQNGPQTGPGGEQANPGDNSNPGGDANNPGANQNSNSNPNR